MPKSIDFMFDGIDLTQVANAGLDDFLDALRGFAEARDTIKAAEEYGKNANRADFMATIGVIVENYCTCHNEDIRSFYKDLYRVAADLN